MCHTRSSRFIAALRVRWDMANTPEHLRSSPALLERRQRPRGRIAEVSYVDLLDGRNGGLVLDISESGLLLQTALKITEEEVSRLRFRLPASDRWIEARARLVWVGESGKEAGVQFLELSEDARARIEEWLANTGLPTSPAGVPGERTISPQTTPEPLASAPIPPTVRAHDTAAPGSAPPGPAQQNRDGFLSSFARPGRVTKLSWRGLGTIVIAVTIVAVLLGLRYSPRLPRLPILDGSKLVRNGPAKAVQSPSRNAVTRSAAPPPQAQSPGLPLNPRAGRAIPSPSSGGQPAPAPLAPKAMDSTFGSMVTQTLSPGSTATKPKAAGIRTQEQKQQLPQSGPQSSDAPFPARARPPDSSRDTILVGAPAVGAPPARVILESEPVRASSLVAVTASRSILVPASEHPTEKLHLGKLVSYVHPVYPADAQASGIEGTVRVRAFIGPSGEVQSVRLLGGPAALAPAAMNAIRKWRYASTLLNEKAIESQTDISVFFRLH